MNKKKSGQYGQNALTGCASQLEALKEEGAKKAKSPEEFEEYRKWLYSIDPRLCLSLEVEAN